jgi:predicted RND superfamily exporter protein
MAIAVCAPLPWRLTPDVKTTEAIPEHSETIQTLKQCDAAFGGSLPVFVVVQWPAGLDLLSQEVVAALSDLHSVMEANTNLSRPLSILNVLQTMPGNRSIVDLERFLQQFPPEVLERLVRRDLSKLLVSARVPDVGAAAVQPTLERLEMDLKGFEARHPGFHLTLTGRTIVAGRSLRQIILDLAGSLALAALVIVGVLTLVFRSVLIGLLSIIPNTLPLLVNAALLQLGGFSLQLTSVVTFSLCLGIAVDDTIHFLMRFRRERQAGWPVGQAILRTYVSVGFVLIATTAILTSGFAVIWLSDVPALRLFAGLTCTAMLTALFADLVILPALLQCSQKSLERGMRR